MCFEIYLYNFKAHLIIIRDEIEVKYKKRKALLIIISQAVLDFFLKILYLLDAFSWVLFSNMY